MEDDLSHILSKELLENKISSTKLSSTGGFLKKGNTTMLIGTDVKSRIIKFLTNIYYMVRI